MTQGMGRGLATLWWPMLLASAADAATLRVPSEYATINAGLDAAVAGDTVLVAPGTYGDYETRLTGGQFWISSVGFLRGDVALVSAADAGATVLRMDASVSSPGVLYAFGEEGTIEVSGFTLTGSSPNVGIVGHGYGGRLVLRDCVLRDVENGQGLGSVLSDVEVYGCRFENINGGGGGGIYQQSGTLLVEDSEFLNCRSGAIQVTYDSHRPHATGLTVRRCRFVGNVKTNGSGGGISTGIYANVLVEDSWFENNLASGGGGVAMGGQTSSQVVRRCCFVRNSGGNGIGGAIDAWGSEVVVDGSTFYGNLVTTNWPDGASAVSMRTTGPRTFRRNVVMACSGDRAVRIESASLTEGCNVFWQNPDGNAQLFTPSATDVEADPLFCDPAMDDFHVGVGSPCLPGSGHPSCTALIGAWGESCGTVAIPPTTWGKVKSGFRTEVRP